MKPCMVSPYSSLGDKMLGFMAILGGEGRLTRRAEFIFQHVIIEVNTEGKID